MKRRLMVLGSVLIAFLAIAAGILIRSAGDSGSGVLESWIGSQFQGIANSYLNPTLTFTDLDYQYPGTVSLKNLRLSADDPGRPGAKVDILACAMAAVTLAEIPRVG